MSENVTFLFVYRPPQNFWWFFFKVRTLGFDSFRNPPSPSPGLYTPICNSIKKDIFHMEVANVRRYKMVKNGRMIKSSN